MSPISSCHVGNTRLIARVSTQTFYVTSLLLAWLIGKNRMDEVDGVHVSKVPQPVTRRNWILQGLPTSSIYEPYSNTSILPGPASGAKRRENDPNSAFFLPVAPVFPQIRFRSLSSHSGVGIMERINNVNDLNEKISETYHRRYGHSDSENNSGSSKVPSFSKRATLLVDQSFSFIDSELTRNGQAGTDNGEVPVSPSYSPTRNTENDSDGMDASKEDEEEYHPPTPDSPHCSTRSDSIGSNDRPSPSRRSSTPQPDYECADELKASTLTVSSELILRCTNDEGEVCAIYEKRPTSPSPVISSNGQSAEDDGSKQEEDNSSSQQSQRQTKRSLHQVSFDDRIVVVDGHDASLAVDDHGPQCDQDQLKLIRRLKKVLRRLLRGRDHPEVVQEVTAIGDTVPRHDSNTYVPGQVRSPAADKDDFAMDSVQTGFDFTKSYFDLPTVCDRLKINPLYEGNAKNSDALNHSVDHYYCDLTPATDRQCSSEELVNDTESGHDAEAQPSYLPTPQVHSKADERLRKENSSDRFLDRFDFEQLRTRRFGVAITIMIIILVLAAIGIGLTIYFD